MSTAFQIALATIAGIVAGLMYFKRKTPWLWILAYWLVLKAKNIVEVVR